MNELTRLIIDDMKPALGVTEPGAIAYAVSMAREYALGTAAGTENHNVHSKQYAAKNIKSVTLRLNSGMFKNAFTCGIAGTDQVGNYYAAALGLVAADANKRLECLDGITDDDVLAAKELIDDGKIIVEMTEITSRIYIEATVNMPSHNATVIIEEAHTKVTSIKVDGKPVIGGDGEELQNRGSDDCCHDTDDEEDIIIHRYTLEQLVEYAMTVDVREIRFINQAFAMNEELLEAGLSSDKTTYAPYLLEANGGNRVSDDEQKTASLFCNGAIEARVIGLPKPAMSITGSGAHGIIATMPLLAAQRVNGYGEEVLLRATALSYLICMYIKEYSGKLSAFCGCAIAAGTGMACGLALMRRASGHMKTWDREAVIGDMTRTINNMASSITGMICDGGNQGCAMKGVVAVDAAYRSVDMAMADVAIDAVHGINGPTPEATMRNMGLIASPGMVGTEKTIVDILENKN